MKRHASRFAASALVALFVAALVAVPSRALAQNDAQLAANAKTSLGYLESSTPLAKSLGQRAYACPRLPGHYQGRFLIGGEYGNGVLFRRGQVAGYYSTSSVSYGLQARCANVRLCHVLHERKGVPGPQRHGRVRGRRRPQRRGHGPGHGQVVHVRDHDARRLAFVFSQQGLMAGMGLQGTKITKLNR